MKSLLFIICFLVCSYLVKGQTTPIQTIGVSGGRVEAKGQFKIDSLGFMGKFNGFPVLSVNSDTLGAFFLNIADGTVYVRDTIPGSHVWKSMVLQVFSKNQAIGILGTDSVQLKNLSYVDSVSNGVVGTIYDSSTWTNFANLQVSGSGVSVVSNQIVVTEADNSYTNFVRLITPTCLDQQTLRVDYRITTLNAGDSGLRTGFVSINPFSISTVQAYINTTTKKIILLSNQNGTTTLLPSSAALPSISMGDSLSVYLINNYQIWTAIGVNRTTGQTVSVSFANTFTFGSPIVVANTGQVTINPGNGTYEINKFSYTSALPKNQLLGVIGYSITQGFYAGSLADGWSRKIGGVVSAGSADYTASILSRLSEIYTMNERNLIIGGLAGNDIEFGISSVTWQANLTAIYDSLTAHGMNVYFTLETPRNGTDITAANTYIKAQWPNRYADIYTPLWSGTGTGMASIFNSGDGTHPNAIGHDTIASVVEKSAIYSNIMHGAKFSSVQVFPGGSVGDVQVNDGANSFAGSSNFNWNNSSKILITKGEAIFGNTNNGVIFPDFTGSGDIPAGSVIVGASSGGLYLSGNTDAGTAGDKVGIDYYNQTSIHSALEVANVSSGFSNLLLMKGGGTVNIGTASPAASAVLNVTSTIQGVLLPRMTTVQKLAISAPAEGLQVYDLTLHQMSYFNGTTWINN